MEWLWSDCSFSGLLSYVTSGGSQSGCWLIPTQLGCFEVSRLEENRREGEHVGEYSFIVDASMGDTIKYGDGVASTQTGLEVFVVDLAGGDGVVLTQTGWADVFVVDLPGGDGVVSTRTGLENVLDADSINRTKCFGSQILYCG